MSFIPSIRIGVVHWRPADGIARALSMTLVELGYSVSAKTPISSLRDTDILLMHGPLGSVAPVIHRLNRLSSTDRPILVYWMSEQFPNPSLPEWFWKLVGTTRSAIDRMVYAGMDHQILTKSRFIDRVDGLAKRYCYFGDLLHMRKFGLPDQLVVQSKWMGERLKDLGFEPKVVPMGFAPDWAADLELERDIPVLWLGKMGSKRRKRLLNDIRNKLRSRGIELMVVDGSENPAVFGKERTVLLNRSMIVLNLLRAEWDDNSLRFYLAAPNRSLIITEPTFAHSPFEPQRHLIEAPPDEIPRVVQHYLDASEKRKAITDAAYELAISELKMSCTVGLVMHEAAQLYRNRN